MKYLTVIEETETGFSAYSPDLPGCASTGKTLEETERNMREAIEFHIQGLREEGYEIPKPVSRSSYQSNTFPDPECLSRVDARDTKESMPPAA